MIIIHYFVWLVGVILYVPVNNFSVMPRGVFLDLTNIKQLIKCLGQAHITVSQSVMSF